MKITPKMLQDAKACTSQYDIFVKEWPKGCLVNKKNLSRVIELLLDLNWAAQKLLSRTQKEVYDAAMAEPTKVYDAARIKAERIYDAARIKAERIYDAARIKAERIYDAARAEAERIYDAAMAEPTKVYGAAKAEAFLLAIKGEITCRKK